MTSDFIGEEIVQPDPVRVIEGLRDTGYTFNTAVADIVDNSIAAEATLVQIHLGLDARGTPFLYVVDNGVGMTPDGLRDAMRYGSPPRPSKQSLGKFGMGLKTASTSFCRRLTLISRGTVGESLAARRWDLDHVVDTGEWYLQAIQPPDEAVDMLSDLAGDGTGTIVSWKKIDRLIKDYVDPLGRPAQNAMKKTVKSLAAHLSVTYSRFLDSMYPGVVDISIRLNEEEITSWDPFCADIGSELMLDEETDVEIEDSTDPDYAETATFSLRAYVIPPKTELNLAEEKRAQIAADRAGFYVYREDRCIAAGGWLGMYTIEPHSSLCRIDFSFDHRLDDAFQIDIKKSRIQMLPELLDHVKSQIQPARREADKRYRGNRTQTAVKAGADMHSPSNQTIDKRSPSLVGNTTTDPIGSDRVEVTNPIGKSIVSISTPDHTPDNFHIEAVETTMDGLLFEPRVFGPNIRGVALSASHPFYQRCYLSENPDIMLQGLDFLFWSIAEAEWEVTSDDDQAMLESLRRKISSLTRKLALELPDTD